MALFKIEDLKDLGDGENGPGVLDPFASLPLTPKGKPGHRVQIGVSEVKASTDDGAKPCKLQPSKGFDRLMHYIAFELKVTLVDADALADIEHPEDEPLPSQETETWLMLCQAEGGGAWSSEEKAALADKIKRAEDMLAPMFDAASMPLQPFNGKPSDEVPASIARIVKGRRGPLGKVIDGDWDEIKGNVYEAEITRREYNGKNYYDYKILGLCPPDRVGAEWSGDDDK